MKQSKRSIQKSVKALGKLIDSTNDPIVGRIAYAVETALRWATIDTTGWERPEKDVLNMADILRRELHRLPRYPAVCGPRRVPGD